MKQEDLYLVSISILGRIKIAWIDPLTHFRFCPMLAWFASGIRYKNTVFQIMFFGLTIALNFRPHYKLK